MITGDRETREFISNALEAEGHPDKAFLATNPASAIMHPSVALPGGADVVRFDSFPHPSASFYVGVAGGRVFYLTESPEAFPAMMRAAGVRVASSADATLVAQWFVETTRAMDVFSRAVSSIDDIEWASGPLAPKPEDVSALTERLRGVIAPASAEARETTISSPSTFCAVRTSSAEKSRSPPAATSATAPNESPRTSPADQHVTGAARLFAGWPSLARSVSPTATCGPLTSGTPGIASAPAQRAVDGNRTRITSGNQREPGLCRR